jgi:hypothetical protein
MPKYLILFLWVLSAALAAPSTAPTEASIRELLDVTKARGLIDGMMVQMDQMMKAAMAQASQGHESSHEVEAVVDRMREKMMGVMKEELDWSVLEPLYISIYQESFSKDEVEGMLAFYRTPVGQSMIQKLPLVIQKSMSSMQERMGPMMKKLQVIQEEAMREVQAGGGAKED